MHNLLQKLDVVVDALKLHVPKHNPTTGLPTAPSASSAPPAPSGITVPTKARQIARNSKRKILQQERDRTDPVHRNLKSKEKKRYHDWVEMSERQASPDNRSHSDTSLSAWFKHLDQIRATVNTGNGETGHCTKSSSASSSFQSHLSTSSPSSNKKTEDHSPTNPKPTQQLYPNSETETLVIPENEPQPQQLSGVPQPTHQWVVDDPQRALAQYHKDAALYYSKHPNEKHMAFTGT